MRGKSPRLHPPPSTPRALSLLLLLTLPFLALLNILQYTPATAGSLHQPDEQNTTLILASRQDPYYPLAEEISAAEGLPIAHHLADVIRQSPRVLLWVVSPAHLSDSILVEFAVALGEHRPVISAGILTGSTLEAARSLWARAGQARGLPVFAVNGEYPAASISEGQILSFARDGSAAAPLSHTALKGVLEQAGYLTFTGHGGNGYWRLSPEEKLVAGDLPHLPPVVIGTASCQTFRIWEKGSIALGFVDRGAAAYAGFAYSPNEGYLIGEFDGLPFRYTWPDFPIGHVVQIQNRGILQGFARFPYYFLLGDPRIALQDSPPYRLVQDQVEGDRRTLVYTGAPPGLLPVRIQGGAVYRFVEILGVAASGEADPFYNARLQLSNMGKDKYLLFFVLFMLPLFSN